MTNYEQFITRLEALDRGDLARFKRSIGRSLGESGGNMLLFYRILPSGVRGKSWEEEDYFLVASLFGISPKQFNTGDLGYSMHQLALKNPNSQDAIDRRMVALLDCSKEALPFRLRQVVRLLESYEMRINWRELLADIRYWDYPDRRIQKKWARSYFGGMATEAPEEPESEITTETVMTK